MLIGIYGGPLLFMEEYRRMLADRLLAKEEYDCVREIRTLELLKIRWVVAFCLNVCQAVTLCVIMM
jgi:anaphase-promoting complex subunit 2